MELQLSVERLAVGGDGIAREPDGRVVFVAGGLPGEVVRAELTSRRADFWRARTIEVISPSADRAAPPCPYVAAGCGGCGWQYVTPSAQPGLKAAMVSDALTRQGHLTGAEVRVGSGVDPARYRTTVRFGVGGDGRLGLRKAASHELVAMEHCPVAHPAISELIGPVRAHGASELVLRVSEATGQRTAMAIAPAGSRPRLDGLPPDVAVGPGARLRETVAGRALTVSAASFFQSSARSASLLVDAVERAAGDTSEVTRWVDLYSGIGLFAATLLRGVPVLAVEQSMSACADARENLADRPATVIEQDVHEWAALSADLVVADPSRDGLGRGGVRTVVTTGASVVVLVSCDAASLGRDAHLLHVAGYRHAGSEVLDLFPQTPHVEVVSRFERVDG